MIHSLVSNALSTGGTLVATVGNQVINGLLLFASAAWDPLDTLQVTLKSGAEPARVLINSLSMRTLAEISDMEGGFSQTARSALTTEAGDTQVLFPVRVPLGCLEMSANDSELEIILRKGAGSGVTCGLGVYLDESETDHVFEYIETRDSRDKFSAARNVWVVSNADLIAYNTKAISVMVESPFGASVADMPTLLAYAMTANQTEWQAPLRVLNLFTSPDPIPDRVSVSITGAAAADFVIVCRQTFLSPLRVSNGTMAAMDRTVQRLNNRTPGEQKALKRAGIAPAVKGLVQARQSMNAAV